MWGLTGSTRIDGRRRAASARSSAGTAPLSPGLAMGLAFLTTGVAFKIAAVPFHYWTPDAYQGSPTPVTGYLSVGPEDRRLRADPAPVRRAPSARSTPTGSVVIVILSTITMTLGNLVALTQDNVKRMLAYSSIAHTGYMLVGLAAWASPNSRIEGLEGLLFYARRLQLHEPRRVRRRGRPAAPARGHQQHRHVRRPRRAASRALAILMTLFLLSLTGIPPTAGFFAKAYVILAGVEAGGAAGVLAVIAVLNAAVAAFYYLRVVVYMFMRDAKGEPVPLEKSGILRVGLGAAAFLTIVLGLFPGALVQVVESAARALVS